jgi:hypothetical protein
MKNMKSNLKGGVALTVAIIISACSTTETGQNNQLSKAEKEQGWELLFDGKTLSGWRGLGRDTVETNHWKVENGEIHKIDNREVPPLPNGDKIVGGDLMTIETFDNFELKFEWKILAAGNSGIKYNVSEEISTTYGSGHNALGFEYQALDDGNEIYKDLNPYQFTGSLYDFYAPSNVHLKPVGEFNQSTILLNGMHGEHWLNGVKVLEYELGTAEFDSLFHASKFANYTGFEKKRSGHIVITNHTDESWYRNIKIRRIE